MKQKPHIEYGGGGMRFIAVVLDTLILLPINVLLISVFSSLPLMGLVANIALQMTYYIGFLSGPWRATPGKRVMGLYVVSTQGLGALSKEQAALRFIAYHIPTFPIYTSLIDGMSAEVMMMALFGVWFIPILMTEEKTGVHDLLCHTRVMKGQL